VTTDEGDKVRDWHKPFKVVIGDGKDIGETTGYRLYTDGSLLDEQTGIGVSIWHRTSEIATVSERLPDERTVFQAEVIAITAGCEYLLDSDISNENIDFLVDNQASLKAISSNLIRQHTVKTLLQRLSEVAAKGNNIRLSWIKAHVGEVGNERADELAKQGSKRSLVGLERLVPIPRASVWSKIKEMNTLNWKQRWLKYVQPTYVNNRLVSTQNCSQSFIFYDQPNGRKASQLFELRRISVGRCVRFLTDFAFLKYHQRIVDQQHPKARGARPMGDTFCRLCKEDDDERGAHIIIECPILWDWRKEIFGVVSLSSLPRDINITKLAKFLTEKDIMWLEANCTSEY